MNNIYETKGWLKVISPRKNIYPLQLLLKQNEESAEIIGTTKEMFFPNAVALPNVHEGDSTTDFSSGVVAKTDIGGSISLLNRVFKILGKGDINGSFNRGDSVTFNFKNILLDSIESEIALHNYIYSAVKNKTMLQSYKDAFDNDKLHVITSVFKSNDFEVIVSDKISGSIKFNMGLKEIIDVEANGNGSKEFSESMKSNGGYMVFAVRAKRIVYKKGE